MKKLMMMLFVFAMAFVAMAAQCAATTLAGTQCKRSAQENGKLCWQHARMQGKNELGTCQGKTADGQPCSRKVEAGAKFCWQHAKSAAAAPVKEAKTAAKETKAKVAKTAEAPAADAAATTLCAAKTADGNPCKHKAQPGSKFCWQHAKSAAKAEATAPAEEAKADVKKTKAAAKDAKAEAKTAAKDAKAEAKTAAKDTKAGALCAAKTADGEPCKNKPQAGSKFCWRHAKAAK